MAMGRTTPRRRNLYALLFALLLIALSGAVGYCMGASASHVSVISVSSTYDAIRAELLTDAMDYVGVYSPEAAAEVWAQGLKRRSAAMQYAVMDTDLRTRYAKALETTAPNWVTGTSSPWVSAYAVTAQEQSTPDAYTLTLRIDTATSAGPAQTLHAVLTIEKRGDFWRITEIHGDEGLSAYTGMPVSP
jgi:hypothetical protein